MSDLERDLSPNTLPPSLDLDAEVPEVIPLEDEPEVVWAWRPPNPRVVLPLSFLYKGTWTRSVVLTPMDGFGEDLMVDDSGSYKDQHERMNEVLSRSTESIGAVRRPEDAKPDRDGIVLPRFFAEAYDAMPMEDRLAVIVRLRQLSVHNPEAGQSGHKFVYSDTCPFDDCKKYIPGLVTRLDTIKRTDVPDEWCQQDVHVYEDGRYRITWRTAKGADEVKMHRVRTERRADLLSGLLFVSILTINGKTPSRFEDIKALPKPTRNGLRNAMEVGGLDITIQTRCPHCRREYVKMLPWEQRGFFFPSGRE